MEDKDLTASERLNPQCVRACPTGDGTQQMELALEDRKEEEEPFSS